VANDTIKNIYNLFTNEDENEEDVKKAIFDIKQAAENHQWLPSNLVCPSLFDRDQEFKLHYLTSSQNLIIHQVYKQNPDKFPMVVTKIDQNTKTYKPIFDLTNRYQIKELATLESSQVSIDQF